MDLDFIPSPIEDRPGLLIRDPFRYSDATLIVPPQLVPCLAHFDGEQTELDLREALVRRTGDLDVGALQQHLIDVLSNAGFLNDVVYGELRERRQREFAAAPERDAAHAGVAYPDEPGQLKEEFNQYLGAPAERHRDGLVAIAAPHVSPFGGVESYRSAYAALAPEHGEKTFVVLGTSHYGEPGTFGLTRKPYVTPYGRANTDTALVGELAQRGGPAVRMEDYCHSFEHTIEFQTVFLQHLFGERVNIVPILCGSFMHSIYEGKLPEQNPDVARFFDALGDIAARESEHLIFVLGIDMAHMGRRYGDPFSARAGQGEMEEVALRDRRRIDCMNRADREGYWNEICHNHDDLKWCGSAPVYTFLKCMPGLRGVLGHYQQWNIDEASVVSFAGMSFHKPNEPVSPGTRTRATGT